MATDLECITQEVENEEENESFQKWCTRYAIRNTGINWSGPNGWDEATAGSGHVFVIY